MKAKKLSTKDIALLGIAAGFAWTKLGVGAAVKEIEPFFSTSKPTPECADGFRAVWDSSKGDWVCIPRL